MLLEVRLEKPSKPDKWDLPADVSLRSALKRAQAERDSKLDGTMVARSAGGTSSSRTTRQPPPHERFFTSGTCIEMAASLHRKLNVEPPVHMTLRSVESPLARSRKNASTLSLQGRRDHLTPPGSSNPSSPKYETTSTDPINDETLRKVLAVTPFTRMIFVFKYMDDDMLHNISDAIEKVNKKALPNMQGSTRSYSYSASEIEASQKGSLDVISGFMIIDDDTRIVCLEGLAGPNQGMESLFIDLPRLKENDDSLKILCNPQVLFPNRAYPEFGPDIRRIRVRDKLKKLARKPELYDRKQVEEV